MLSIKIYAGLFLLMIMDPPGTQAKPLEDNLENDVKEDVTKLSPVQQSPHVGALDMVSEDRDMELNTETPTVYEEENLEVLPENDKEVHETVDLTEESRDKVEELHEIQTGYLPQQLETDLYQNELELVTDRIDTSFDTSNITDDSSEYESYTNCEVEGDYYDYLADVPTDNPCEVCQCMEKGVVCIVQECEVPAGNEDCLPLPPESDACCSTEYECNVLSRTGASDLPVSTTEAASDFQVTTTKSSLDLPVLTTEAASDLPVSTTEAASDLQVSTTEAASDFQVTTTKAASDLHVTTTETALDLPVPTTEAAPDLPVSTTEAASDFQDEIHEIIESGDSEEESIGDSAVNQDLKRELIETQEVLEGEDPEEDNNTDYDESKEDDSLSSQTLEETREVFERIDSNKDLNTDFGKSKEDAIKDFGESFEEISGDSDVTQVWVYILPQYQYPVNGEVMVLFLIKRSVLK